MPLQASKEAGPPIPVAPGPQPQNWRHPICRAGLAHQYLLEWAPRTHLLLDPAGRSSLSILAPGPLFPLPSHPCPTLLGNPKLFRDPPSAGLHNRLWSLP